MAKPLCLYAPSRRDVVVVAPSVVLALMAGMTNAAYRALCLEQGTGLYVCEMMASWGIVAGDHKTHSMLVFNPSETICPVQLYGVDPKIVARAVRILIAEHGVHHIDLSFGCSVPKATRRGGGGVLPYKHDRLCVIIRVAARAADEFGAPVTVKTWIGIDEAHETFLDAGSAVEEEGAAVIALHARTMQQAYSDGTDWSRIAELKRSASIPVLGNGDLWEARDALRMMTETDCDGVVIGRGCLGRPQLFGDLAAAFAGEPRRVRPTLGEVGAMIIRHAELPAVPRGERGAVDLHKHMVWHFKGYPAGELRWRFAVVISLDELRTLVGLPDADQPFPVRGLGTPRGRQGGPRGKVVLPHGWYVDTNGCQFDLSDAEDGVSGGQTDFLSRLVTGALHSPDMMTEFLRSEGAMMFDTVTLIVDGIPHELPLVTGTERERAVDIPRLRPTTGLITLDDTYNNASSCSSAITFIDGERGILRYRGVPIEDLASRSSFIEVAELLIFGDLPDDDKRDEFRQLLIENPILHRDMRKHFNGFPVDAHSMVILSAMINAIQAYDLPEIHITGEAGFRRATALPLAKARAIAMASYKSYIGQPIVCPRYDLPYAEDFLHMMLTMSCRDYEVIPEMARALNTFFVPHADHEQNCSTSTVRVAASSGANLFTVISAGVTVLWGPLHGGVSMGAIEMLERIRNGGMSVGPYLAKAKDRKSGIRLMGSGHRIYRNSDPRTRILKKVAHGPLESMNIDDPLLDIAREVEEAALADDYFAERRFYPNADSYPGIILRATGIPLDMLTMLLAIGCTVG